MRKIFLSMFLLLCCSAYINAQNVVKGIVVDGDSENALQSVLVSVKNTTTSKATDVDGVFNITGIINGNYIVEIKLAGYETQNFPVELSGNVVDLGTILLFKDITEDQDLSLITITDDELNDDASAADNISGLLQATKDVFLRSAAFEFSSSFFRIKGLDSGNGKVLINGIEMNKIYDGRAQWSNWGGLNDVLRNQEFSNGLSPSNFTFGGVLGSTNMNTRASQQRPGVRISYSSSNRSYQHRAMATYSTGMLEDGWAMTFSGSRRAGIEGFNDGTTYNAYSLFASIEKKINDNHSLSFTSIFTPNRRGKSSPNTQEVFDLKGIEYNEYWGNLNGRKVNSRIKEVEEPILMLNHFWDISEGTSLQTNVAYQFGKIGNSRLDFNGGANPSPTYYQYLPSFFVRNDDLAGAYTARENFENDGQIDWNRIFDANITNATAGTNNAYVLYEDRNDDKQFTVNTILNTDISNNITLNGKLEYKRLRSNNFAEVVDLLGGNGYLDINNFADTEAQKQNDLQNPNRVVSEGDTFRYNYNLNSDLVSVFAQAQFKYNKVDFYTAANVSRITHQREGLYQNGRFQNNSLGESEKLDFTNYGVKAGATYKVTGRHLLDANVAYLTQAPTIRNSFSNSRENNNIVENLQSEKVFSADASYIVRSPIITSRLTGYYTSIKDATEISFYFADGVGGDNTAFVQEILSGIEKKHVGLELGIEAQVTPTIKLKGAASIGQFTYDNNPDLYLTSDVINEGVFDANGRSKNYTSNLKNYKIAAGPHKAYSVGFEYRDPDYWWVGATTNFFSNTYVDVAPLTRSSNFYEDSDGLAFPDYDLEVAKELLQQERFDDYMVVNLIGGKSWKIDDKYISVFATVNNLLGTEYKSGGFEQGRNANYRQLREDKSLDTPVFGNKYWYGRGATYFLNVNISF
ncbi:carboxypeptidase-like regulatory domain-containing protein [Polaribacter haliotis]|uniref:Carboxypeptidase-like regulatory domain-containing protein n=1 Tax=Polaribacter haliotis TaxID=1888915 RepID=A0A7L8AE00_9FLAO|nr:carboxypeptidase-like regulatory domain-containing protein [Polaribacter haliotis]QOD60154.1 carboxypeptidase-like regulatory domain-containing protein [Polaribacter haliotis]